MYKKILVPIDLKHESSWRKSLPTAIDHAQQYGGELYLINVVPEIDMSLPAVHLPKDFGKKMREEAKRRLDDFIKTHLPENIPAKGIIGQGSIYKEVLRAAEDINADMIVMASHKPEMKDYLLGANAARVVRHATCSVLVVRE